MSIHNLQACAAGNLLRSLMALLLLLASNHALSEASPFADIHLHFNWDQKEVIAASEVVERLKAANVVLATVSGTPSELALELAEAGKPWIVPFFSPYISEEHRKLWPLDKQVLVEAEKGLATGLYRGIGELHIWSGLGPRQDNEVLVGLLKLAAQYRVPFLIHTEASSHIYFQRVCQKYPDVRFLWAHAGGRLKADSIDQLMQACANVWVEVSARDPWRYDSLVDDNGQLLPGWKELFMKYPDRFMTGTDPVWLVLSGQRWDEPDEGWNHHAKLLDFHRRWLQQLPPAVESRIRLENAQQYFGIPGRSE